MTRTQKIILLSTLSALVTACGASTQAETKSVDTNTAVKANAGAKVGQNEGYIKPGASVSITHDFTGFVQPGSTGNVRVTFKSALDAGTLEVKANTNGEISLSPSSMQKKFELDTLDVSEGKTMNVSFSTQAPGLKYINLQAFTTDAAGQTMGRAFTIPIQVGDPKYNVPQKPSDDLQTTPSGELLIVTDAEETIK